MIKVHNGVASREPLPKFLKGLSQESLQDLTWTDPSLGVSTFAWYPELDESISLTEFQRYGTETLTIDEERKVVVSQKEVVDFSEEEKQEILAHQESLKEEEVRSIRNGLLSDTDWTVLQDSPFTSAQTADWVIYRQALRDITGHANFPYLNDADWPTKP